MKNALRSYIEQQLLDSQHGATVGDEDDLLGSGLLDSVAMMSLVLFVEERFGVRVPPEDVTIENFYSIKSIADYLERQPT